MKITTDFDSGSIDVVALDNPQNIHLRLRGDNQSCNSQWFHFRLETAAGTSHQITIQDAGSSTFAAGWENYQAFASYDTDNWFRVPTQYDGQDLVIQHVPEHDEVSYAYYPPYSQSRQAQQLADTLASSHCRHVNLGFTVEGRNVDLLVVENEQAEKHFPKQNVWIIARQHPGETMAQWFIEGLLAGLTAEDETAVALLEECRFYIVANMNPDGSAKGNHRTNAAGVNLNSVWHEPSITDSPEVFYVREKMQELGVDLLLDIHGDEGIPYSFMMGGNASEALMDQALLFKQDLERTNENFQTTHDYDSQKAAGGNGCCGASCTESSSRTIATDYVEAEFGCLALFLEMPFKAADPDNRDQQVNPQEMCKGLAVSVLDTIRRTMPSRRRAEENVGSESNLGYCQVKSL